MANFLNQGFGAALKRIFGRETKAGLLPESSQAAEQIAAPLKETENPVSLTIWTIERNRFSAARALCTDVEVYPSESVVLCEDIAGYVLNTPNGECVVVEAKTGSLVGHSLETVRDGVREMPKNQLNTQLDTARKEFNRMKHQELSTDEFWKAIKMGGDETEIAQDYQV